ncbi:MAG: Uma2 family endonuclease [Microscillaceae bacterium]|nr:Uma2 family endonuclease [Microscillaceae bacterium]
MKISETIQYELERNKPMPSKLHSIIQSNLIGLFFVHYNDIYRVYSELSISLEGWDSVPDIAIYNRKEENFREDEIQMSEVPLGVIEILSPTQNMQELIYKAERYFQQGVLSCWLVFPLLKNIYVFENREYYQIFKHQEELKDDRLNIRLSLEKVFH